MSKLLTSVYIYTYNVVAFYFITSLSTVVLKKPIVHVLYFPIFYSANILKIDPYQLKHMVT